MLTSMIEENAANIPRSHNTFVVLQSAIVSGCLWECQLKMCLGLRVFTPTGWNRTGKEWNTSREERWCENIITRVIQLLFCFYVLLCGAVKFYRSAVCRSSRQLNLSCKSFIWWSVNVRKREKWNRTNL